MRDIPGLKKLVLEAGLDVKLLNLLEVYVTVLPKGQSVFSDYWDVIDWVPRPGNKRAWMLNFDIFQNSGMKLLVKMYILNKRFSKKIYAATATSYIFSICYLDKEMGGGVVGKLSAEHFYATEKALSEKFSSKAIMYLRTLQAFSNWLRVNFFPILDYTAPCFSRDSHGRGGTDTGRAAKLLPDEVVSQLFCIARRSDLDERDKFFLNAFVLDTVIQGRINELATLPVNCLIENSGILAVKVFSEKGGVLGVRHFPQMIAPAVKEAVSHIKVMTEGGRKLVRELKENPALDWRLVVLDDVALRYFTSKFVAEWTCNHKLLDGNAIWSKSLGCVIDAIGTLQQHQGSFRRACESLRVSNANFRILVKKQEGACNGNYLVTDSGKLRTVDFGHAGWRSIVRKNPLAVSIIQMEKFYEITLWQHSERVSDILDEGLRCQMEGKVYSQFKDDPVFEEKFQKKILPVVSGRNGESLLEAEDALFVVPRNLFNSQKTRSNQYQLISDDIFSDWLYGQRVGDSVFHKFDIRNPQTGGIADFTWHDIRHWLQTVLKKGGLTDAQASLLAGRKDSRQAAVYDQTPALVRSEQLSKMRHGIKSGEVIGSTADTYQQLKVENSQLAEEYLTASTLVLSWMPHGACTRNIALAPCVNHLSCFSTSEDGRLCSHLQIDSGRSEQVQEISKVHRSSLAMIHNIEEAGGAASPQYEHYSRVARNTSELLKKL